jgi:hypothetical protein
VHSSSVTGASKRPEAATVIVLPNSDLVSKDDLAARLAYRWREVMKLRFLNILVVPVSTSA